MRSKIEVDNDDFKKEKQKRDWLTFFRILVQLSKFTKEAAQTILIIFTAIQAYKLNKTQNDVQEITKQMDQKFSALEKKLDDAVNPSFINQMIQIFKGAAPYLAVHSIESVMSIKNRNQQWEKVTSQNKELVHNNNELRKESDNQRTTMEKLHKINLQYDYANKKLIKYARNVEHYANYIENANKQKNDRITRQLKLQSEPRQQAELERVRQRKKLKESQDSPTQGPNRGRVFFMKYFGPKIIDTIGESINSFITVSGNKIPSSESEQYKYDELRNKDNTKRVQKRQQKARDAFKSWRNKSGQAIQNINKSWRTKSSQTVQNIQKKAKSVVQKSSKKKPQNKKDLELTVYPLYGAHHKYNKKDSIGAQYLTTVTIKKKEVERFKKVHEFVQKHNIFSIFQKFI